MTTTANKIDPYYPIHPGEIIKDELEFRGISQRKLADRIGVSHTQLNEILNCKRPVSSEIALLLEAALGLEPEALVAIICRLLGGIQRSHSDWKTSGIYALRRYNRHTNSDK